ncbi:MULTISPECIES: AraC family transcriptional regulator [Marinobacter]|uniref:AraC family transcriptional regulator n=1 Tax=Marinobacter TaxID=2742 RepID=UPI001D08E6E7|nr:MULTISPECIES: helix-turn-helix transcriptional regulator [Marinobacter]MCK7568969.1 helix-turn-helix transcriptional regulator [Marinobacter xestospongiae]UDL06778.1 helix-turn-helix transcriptional regulator [Marinobacter sp. CA1]
MNDSNNVHDNEFSEWLGGPPLISRWWKDNSSDSQRPGERSYNWHRHRRGQMFSVESGLIHVETQEGSWILPPHRAGWIPPEAMHVIRFSSAPNGWMLMLTPEVCEDLPGKPCVIGVSELLEALVTRTIGWSKLDPLVADQERILSVIIDEIGRTPHESLHLPIPKEARLASLTRMILEDPAKYRTIEQWAATSAMSARTLRRLIREETGMSFGQWRQQAQLIHALEMLARGATVADVAHALGYASPSNFIVMFRRALGDSPAHYFANAPFGEGASD